MKTDIEIVRSQVFYDVDAGKSFVGALGAAVFNHGVELVRKAFGLPAPRIRSIFYRPDCRARARLAAAQMCELSSRRSR